MNSWCRNLELLIKSRTSLIWIRTKEEERLEKLVNFSCEKLNIKRSDIPAVTHVDYSARIQTVHKDTNPKYYSLIKKFKEKTNCSVLINTSFNVRGEPIVNTPKDAFNCFMGTELDKLVIGNFFLFNTSKSFLPTFPVAPTIAIFILFKLLY